MWLFQRQAKDSLVRNVQDKGCFVVQIVLQFRGITSEVVQAMCDQSVFEAYDSSAGGYAKAWKEKVETVRFLQERLHQ